MKNITIEKESKKVSLFFFISHGLPILTLLIALLIARPLSVSNPLSLYIIYGGMMSPMIAAIVCIFKFYNKDQRKEFWYRIIDYKRVSWILYVFIFTYPILIRFMGSVINAVLIGGPSDIINNLVFSPSTDMTILYAVFLLFFGPIPEEIGWRGYALNEVQKKMSFNKSALLVGIMWAIWHLPLYFVEGTYQNQLGFLSLSFWSTMIALLFGAVIYSLIFNKTEGSTLAAILFHYFDNLAGESIIMEEGARVISTILQVIIALTILYLFHKKRNILNKKYI